MTRTRLGLAAGLALLLVLPLAWSDEKEKPAEEKVAGPGGLTLTVRMQGPYDADVPLQVVCYFRPRKDRPLKGAPVELDKRLGGVIANLLDRGEFAGDELETLLLDTKGKIPTKRLLLVGLGDEESLSLDRMERVGRVAYREAAKLGAAKVGVAPQIRDQGNDKLAACDVARYVVRGLLLAQDTDARLQKEGLSKKYAMTQWIQEAGKEYFDDTVGGVKKGVGVAKAVAGKRKAAPFIKPKE